MAQLKAASSGEIRAPLFKSPVRMTAKSSMHRSRMSSNNAMHTDLRLAHSLLMWTLATVKWSTTGQTPSRTCQQQSCPRQSTKSTWASRRRGWAYTGSRIVVEEHGAMVLGDHVEVLHQRTLGDKAEPSCTQIKCQRPLRCEATKLGSEPRAGLGSTTRSATWSVGRRSHWSVLKACRGDRRGKRSRSSAVGSQSLKR